MLVSSVRDTSTAMQARYFGHLAKLSLAQRAERLVQLTTATLDLARAGIKQQLPDATPRVIDAHLAYRQYGRAIVERYFPDVYPPSD
jgi:hypothetical protein